MINTSSVGFTRTSGLRSSGIASRPHPVTYPASFAALLLSSDLMVFVVALAAALHLGGSSLASVGVRHDVAAPAGIAVGLWIVLFARMGLYRRSLSVVGRDEIYAAIAGGALALLPALAVVLIWPSPVALRLALALGFVLSFVGLACSRFAVCTLRDHIAPTPPRRVAVVGTSARVGAIPSELALTVRDAVLRIPVAEFDERLDDVLADGDIGRLGWLAEAIAWQCDTLIVTEALPSDLLPAILRLTESHGIRLAYSPLRIRPHGCELHVDRDGSLALIYPRTLTIGTPTMLAVRRAIDLALVVPALVVLAPVFAAIAAAVVLDSGRPIFYRQVRVGLHGREFKIVKFRTMRPDAEAKSGPVWAKSGEDRTTRIGKFLRRTSLDELPQLFNVLRGEMSLVGPRPERPFYVAQFRRMLPRYDERHLVRPGITGWSHVYMKRNIDTSGIGERLSYDLFYLEHWSLFMDAMILVKTIAEVLFHDAAA